MSKRPSWDLYFLQLATLTASRTTCLRRQVGAVIVKDRQVLATGYNGAPIGCKHCEDVGCIRNDMCIPSGERHELCRGAHAEQNAIVQAARRGISIDGSTLYITTHPCMICTKLIINSGIVRVVHLGYYPDAFAQRLFNETNIEVVHHG